MAEIIGKTRGIPLRNVGHIVPTAPHTQKELFERIDNHHVDIKHGVTPIKQYWDCDPLVPSVCDTEFSLCPRSAHSRCCWCWLRWRCCPAVWLYAYCRSKSVWLAVVAYFLKSSIRVCGNSELNVIDELSAVVSDVLLAVDSLDCVPLDLPLDSLLLVESMSCRISDVMNGSNFLCADTYNWLK